MGRRCGHFNVVKFLLPKNEVYRRKSVEMCPIVNTNFCENEVCVGKVCVGKVDGGKFSWLKKLVPITEFVLRFVHNFKALLNQCEVTKVGLLLAEIII